MRWPMPTTTYGVLSLVLLGSSLVLVFGSILLAIFCQSSALDPLIMLAILPGGLILGFLLFLVNGTLENYAVVLPRVFRERPSNESVWRKLYKPHEMSLVTLTLAELCRSLAWSEEDVFQLHPDDRLWDVYRQAFPKQEYPACLGVPSPPSSFESDWEMNADKLLRQNAPLREYVRAALSESQTSSYD